MPGLPDNHAPSSQPSTLLLVTDSKNSMVAELADGLPNPSAYSAYGYQTAQRKTATHLGFNGELRESKIGWYLLGKGYRAYNPKLMRFHSPDNLSPFGRGGLNAYMYCVGDPINLSDPTGHMFKKALSLFGKKSGKTTTGASSSSGFKRLESSTDSLTQPTTTPGRVAINDSTQGIKNTTNSMDPSTGEPIHDVLTGRRTWSPPTRESVPAGMMTFAELADIRIEARVWRSEMTPTRVNDTGGKVYKTTPKYRSNGGVVDKNGQVRMSAPNMQRMVNGEPPLFPAEIVGDVRKT